VLQLAEQIERNGRQYYFEAAQAYEGGRGVFLELAQVEMEHEKAFADMRVRLALKPSPPIDEDGNLAHYIRNLAAGTFFEVGANPATLFQQNDSTQDILWTAVGLEKQSILFYEGVERILPEPGDRKTVDAIIAAEMGHIGMLVKFQGARSDGRPLSPPWSGAKQ
jgi:rubrerythrin